MNVYYTRFNMYKNKKILSKYPFYISNLKIYIITDLLNMSLVADVDMMSDKRI